MARIIQYNDYLRDKKADLVLAELNGGYIRLYNGAMPANGNAIPAGVQLVQVDLDDPAGVSENGVITISDPDVALGIAASNASVGAWFTAGGQHLGNFNVGPTDSDGYVLELDSVAIEINGEVELTGMTWTEAATSE